MAAVDRNNPKRAKSSESRYSLMEFMADFPDDAACLDFLWRTRYAEDGEHAYCPKCEQVRSFARYGTAQRRQSWTCTGCGLHLHPTAGTVFHKSSTSLHLWFYAMYMMTSTRCGISAKQMERELGVTYKTAWRMFHLIRGELMGPGVDPLTGEVEMDETYIGGKPRQSDRAQWMNLPTAAERRQAAQKWSDKKKVPVFGMVERGGQVAAQVVPSTQRQTLVPIVEARVSTDATLYTDDAKVYRGLRRNGYTDHHTVNHTARVYVDGQSHTQTIEGFWSLVKRGLDGSHHAVSAKHLQGYLNEYIWRYNHRDNNLTEHAEAPAMFALLLLRAALPVSI